MDARVTMDTKPESFFGNLIEDPIAKLNNVFLKRLVPCWVIQHLTDDSGVARTQDILLRNADQISDTKTRHKRIV